MCLGRLNVTATTALFSDLKKLPWLRRLSRSNFPSVAQGSAP